MVIIDEIKKFSENRTAMVLVIMGVLVCLVGAVSAYHSYTAKRDMLLSRAQADATLKKAEEAAATLQATIVKEDKVIKEATQRIAANQSRASKIVRKHEQANAVIEHHAQEVRSDDEKVLDFVSRNSN